VASDVAPSDPEAELPGETAATTDDVPEAGPDAARPKKDAAPPAKNDAGKPDASIADASTSDSGSPSLPGVDRTACIGASSSSGSVYATTPNPHQGLVQSDPSNGGLRLILLPNASAVATNDVVIGLYFAPIPGQLDYTPNGSVGCAILRATSSGWAVVDKTQLCELHFSVLQHASAASVCDGMIAGTFNGIFSGNQPVAGTFVLPSKIPASQVKAPSCRPHDSVCSKHADCCSQSCSPVLGLCQ
jgi:hypothetical protein